jgi:pimeloyl-ACP methyl ester carboxylesterase
MNVQQKLALAFIRTKLNVLTRISKKKAAEQAFRLFCTPLAKKTRKENDAFKDAEHLQFPLNGLPVKGYRCGHPKPHKVLLLHGFSSSCHNFHAYVAPLVESGCEVLAFDAPAHGASGGKTVHAVEYSAMIKKIIELYGPVQGFLAHSFGGIALSLALEETPHDKDTRVVLIAPATETSTAIDSAFTMLSLRNPVLRKAIDAVIFTVSGRETAWFSIRRAMKNIRANVLWIHDEDDDITPVADALKVKDDNHSHVKFVFTKELGHRRIYRDPGVRNEAIHFLCGAP